MNSVDLVVAAALFLFALRGYWRGLFRESFGLLALFGGLAAAMRFASDVAVRLEPSLTVPAVREGSAFVLVFVITYGLAAVIGGGIHRLAGSAGWSRANRLGGVVVGAGKGGALLAFVLLFLRLFPLLPTLETRLAESRLAPPLVHVASSVIRFGLGPTSPSGPANLS